MGGEGKDRDRRARIPYPPGRPGPRIRPRLRDPGSVTVTIENGRQTSASPPLATQSAHQPKARCFTASTRPGQNWPSPTHNAENLLYYAPLHFTISTELSFEFLEDLFATASPSVNTVSVNSVIIRTLRPGIPRSHGGNSARHRTRRCRRQIGGPADTGGRPAGR